MRRCKSILAIVFLAASLVSCSGKDRIVGKWTLMDIDYSEHLSNIDPEQKESFISMMDRQGAKILQKTFFKFEEPEAFFITTPNFNDKTTTMEGRWALNEAKDSLVIENEGFETYAVSFKDDNTLLLHSGEAPFRVLTLVKK